LSIPVTADEIINVPPIIIARCLLALSFFKRCKLVTTAGTAKAIGNTLLVMVSKIGSADALWLLFKKRNSWMSAC
jgi:hypothetical protein